MPKRKKRSRKEGRPPAAVAAVAAVASEPPAGWRVGDTVLIALAPGEAGVYAAIAMSLPSPSSPPSGWRASHVRWQGAELPVSPVGPARVVRYFPGGQPGA